MAQIENIAIDQGATLRKSFLYTTSLTTLSPVDLTGYSARAQLRKTPSATATEVSLTDVASTDGQVILGGSAGTVTIYIVDAATMRLSGGGVYDVELVSPAGEVVRLVQGQYQVSPNITR